MPLDPNDIDFDRYMRLEDDHVFKGAIIPIRQRGERVANHGIVTCSCGWSTGERITLIEAQQIANREHPEGVVLVPGY